MIPITFYRNFIYKPAIFIPPMWEILSVTPNKIDRGHRQTGTCTGVKWGVDAVEDSTSNGDSDLKLVHGWDVGG